MSSEFDLIKRYFTRTAPDGYLGVGDDCALLPIPSGRSLVTSTDLLLEGRHFLSDIDPFLLGHKTLAVNVSDLAAMGAVPAGSLLGLAVPDVDHAWLQAFSEGFHAFAEACGCPLIGGDTTRSVDGIVISVTVMGHVDPKTVLRRDAAVPGDDIWVTGELGAPDVALALLQGRLPHDAQLLAATRPALEAPQPPWRFAQRLGGVGHAALDISDGLAQDLGHILRASGCGATVYYAKLPIHPGVASLAPSVQHHAVLAGGDVYQLCFTAPSSQRERLHTMANEEGVRLARVGVTTTEPGLRILDDNGKQIILESAGFDHFGDRA